MLKQTLTVPFSCNVFSVGDTRLKIRSVLAGAGTVSYGPPPRRGFAKTSVGVTVKPINTRIKSGTADLRILTPITIR